MARLKSVNFGMTPTFEDVGARVVLLQIKVFSKKKKKRSSPVSLPFVILAAKKNGLRSLLHSNITIFC